MTLCKLPTDFRVLVRPQALRSKKKQKLKSRWEIVSPIKGYVNPQKLAFDHFPFRYLHDQQYVKKPEIMDLGEMGGEGMESMQNNSTVTAGAQLQNVNSNSQVQLLPELEEADDLMCSPVADLADMGTGGFGENTPKYVLVNPNSKNYNSALGSSKTQIISSLPLPVEISELPYHRCYGSNLYACFLPKGFKVYHRQGPRGCAATHISGGCRRPWKRRDVEESQAALAYYCPLCEILLCAACAFDPKLCEKIKERIKPFL
eukprot:g4187.t1